MNFKVGDKVRIIGKTSLDIYWVSLLMDETIGKIGEIDRIEYHNEIKRNRFYIASLGWWYDENSLELIDDVFIKYNKIITY